jgi:glyoxylase-like metal-dependent hydrolase (beta-lactamase superfamily II)
MSGAVEVPEVFELVPGVFQLGAKGGSRMYLVRGTRKNLLIDTGLATDFPVLERQLAQLGLGVADIPLAVLTHEHIDHIGGVPFLDPGTTVAAHLRAANKIDLQDEFVMMNRAFGSAARKFPVDIHLEGGTIIDVGGCALHALHTPGHCSGAICLYDPARQLLFTGDTIFAGGTLGGIFPSGNISDYIATLQQLNSLRVAQFFPGHGRISTDPAGDFERAIHASLRLMHDTGALFEALNTREEFGRMMRSISTYSKRV